MAPDTFVSLIVCFSVPVYIPLSLFFYLFCHCLIISLSTILCPRLYGSLSAHIFVCLCLLISAFLYLSVHQIFVFVSAVCLCRFLFTSVSLADSLSVCPSICLSFFRYVSPCLNVFLRRDVCQHVGTSASLLCFALSLFYYLSFSPFTVPSNSWFFSFFVCLFSLSLCLRPSVSQHFSLPA
jgi:hypothetical protein